MNVPDEADPTIQHIVRLTLPWNEPDLTQCGLPLDNLRLPPLTRDEFNARLKKLGARSSSALSSDWPESTEC